MTLQELLILAGLRDRGTDPNATLGNFQNPFNAAFNVTTPSPFVPGPSPITSPAASTPSLPPPAIPSPPAPDLRESMVNGGLATNDFAEINPGFAEIGPEFAGVTGPSNPTNPDFVASFPDTPGFAANALGHALTMGLSAVPMAGPFLGLAARLIGLPNMIAKLVTPNVILNPNFLINDPLDPNNPSPFEPEIGPTLSLEVEPFGPSPAFSDFEALSSAPDEPGNEGESEGEGEGEGGDE